MRTKSRSIKYLPNDVDICPICKSRSITVYDTRNEGRGRRRQRKCNECGYRYTTIEMMIDDYRDLTEVIKWDKLLEIMQRR